MNLEMTSRFCEIPIKEMDFPLKHPKTCLVDLEFEKLTEKIIVQPWGFRFKAKIAKMIKKTLRIDADKSLTQIIKHIIR